ncbi:MAG: 5'-deoxynucleotidase [Oscillospiraceae bacterium]
MRQSRTEYVAEHTTEVMQLAHTLAVISRVHFDTQVDEKSIVLCALYHDISEILTGDMPTPVKYNDNALKTAYKEMEAKATDKLLDTLGEDLKPSIKPYVTQDSLTVREKAILKGADRLSALIKCIEEQRSGSCEFDTAYRSVLASLEEMKLPEVDYFIEHMLPSYRLCLDDLAKI